MAAIPAPVALGDAGADGELRDLLPMMIDFVPAMRA
jgi:hypothetical protein